MPRFSRLAYAIPAFFMAQILFLWAYWSRDTAPAFWDYAMYANMAIQWHEAVGQQWALFLQSFAQNYNLLFAVPSLLSFSLFGASRTVFLLTNAVCFFIPYQLACALVIKRLFQKNWAMSLILSLIACSLTPFLWYPLFQGYPDHAAATCLVLAFGLSLSPPLRFRDIVAIGFLLGLSIVFRRHFVYPALFLFITMGLFDLQDYFRKIKNTSNLRRDFWSYAFMGGACVLSLLIMEPAYVLEALTTNYSALYKSYERPPFYFLLFAFSRIGLIPLCLCLAGYGLHLYLRAQEHRKLSFVLVFFGLWLTLWSLGPAQAGDHYLISAMPLFQIIGLVALFLVLQKQGGLCLCFSGQKKFALITGFAVFGLLGVNTVHAFWLAPFELPSSSPQFRALAAPRPPWHRLDRQTLRDMASWVSKNTTETDKIVVVGSSFVFNQDLVRALYTDELRDLRPAYRFIPAPESDGQQEAPLDAFASATAFLVATPTQYHLSPDGQKVVTALASRFPPSELLSSSFEALPERFELDHGVTVQLWKKKQLSLPLLHESLSEMRNIRDLPREWVMLNPGGLWQFSSPQDILILHHSGQRASTLFLDRLFQMGSFRVVIEAEPDPRCENVSFTAQTFDEVGTPLQTKNVELFAPSRFVYLLLDRDPNDYSDGRFLTLSVHTKTRAEACTVAIKQLHLEQVLAE